MIWREQAACLGYPELFLYPEHRGGAAKSEAKAKAICRGCPVRTACLAEAERLGPTNATGIWGGLTDEERQERRKERAA